MRDHAAFQKKLPRHSELFLMMFKGLMISRSSNRPGGITISISIDAELDCAKRRCCAVRGGVEDGTIWRVVLLEMDSGVVDLSSEV